MHTCTHTHAHTHAHTHTYTYTHIVQCSKARKNKVNKKCQVSANLLTVAAWRCEQFTIVALPSPVVLLSALYGLFQPLQLTNVDLLRLQLVVAPAWSSTPEASTPARLWCDRRDPWLCVAKDNHTSSGKGNRKESKIK